MVKFLISHQNSGGTIRLYKGPSTIQSINPDPGEFKLTRGKTIFFPGIFENSDGETINREETWVWGLAIEGSPLYNQLKTIPYSGQIASFTTAYGDFSYSGAKNYNAQVLDIQFTLIEKQVFNDYYNNSGWGKVGYKVTMTLNVID